MQTEPKPDHYSFIFQSYWPNWNRILNYALDGTGTSTTKLPIEAAFQLSLFDPGAFHHWRIGQDSFLPPLRLGLPEDQAPLD